MMRKAIIITGYPGAGSTTQARMLSRHLGWPLYYAGGVIRWLAERMDEDGREKYLSQTNEEIIRGIVGAMKTGQVPERPKIAEDYQTFPPRLDELVDDVQTELLEKGDVGVHEGRLAAHQASKLRSRGLAQDKIFVSICYYAYGGVSAKRQLKRPENTGKGVDQIMKETAERLQWEKERYKELYGIEEHLARRHFNILIDTTFHDADRVFQVTLAEIKKFCPHFLPDA